MNKFDIVTIDNETSWRELTHDWNRLLSNSRSDTFFLTWEWLLSWMECCFGGNRSLFILAFYRKENLVGVAPFYIERKKHLSFLLREIRFLGSPESGSDYLDVFTQKGQEQVVANALYDYLINGDGSKSWDKMVLTDMNSKSLFMLHFMSRIEYEGKYSETTRSSFCPLMDLPDNEADLYAMLSPRWRKKIKQDIRVVNREQNVSHETFQGDRVAGQLDKFFKFYEQKSGWSKKQLQTILERLDSKYNFESPIQIDFLSIDGQLLAGLLHFKYQGSLAMYLMVVDKKYNPKVSLGSLLVGQSIINAISSGYSVYDFLKGAESYKFHWATDGNSTLCLRFWQKHPGSVCSAFTRLFKYMSKIVLR